MDHDRFDRLAKSLVSRRSGLGLGLAALLGVGSVPAADAKKKKPCGPCKRRVKGKCKPKPNGTNCVGGRCQGGRCVPTQPCTSDVMCGSDGNGACRCDLPSGACVTDFSPTDFVPSCRDCPVTTICVVFFEGNACIPRCGG